MIIDFIAVLGGLTLVIIAWNMYRTMQAHDASTKQFIAQLADKVRVVELDIVDQHNPDSLILAYDSEDHTFLGQGQSIQQLQECIMANFPEKYFILDEKVFSRLPTASK